MPIAIYARKSTESEDRQVQSLDDQISALTRLAERENLRVAEVFQESKSAKAPGSRPEFERLRKKIEKGQITGVLTWSMDRLSRNPVDGGFIAYLLQIGQLEFIRTTERIYQPDGNALLLSIENGMATAYLQDLSRNVKRGMRGKAERGWHPCKAPVGYLNDPETREIVIDPKRFPLVRRAFELVMQGTHSISEIHQQVTSMGLTAKTRGPKRPLSCARLREVLKEPFYCGRLCFNGEVYEGRHEPVVTESEFEMVQAQLGRIGWRLPNKPRFAFGNLFRCAVCGSMIVGELKRKRLAASGAIASYTYYHCSGSRGCPRSGVREEVLQERLLAIVESVRIPRKAAEKIIELVSLSVEKDACSEAAALADLQEEQKRIEARKRALLEMRLDGEVSPDEFRSAKDELLSKADLLREQITYSRNRTSLILKAICQRLDAAVASGDLIGGDGDPRALAHAARRYGETALNLKTLEFKLDPLIEKIASLELPENGSGSLDNGDFEEQDLLWSALVADLRTTADLMEKQNRCMDLYAWFRSPQFKRTKAYRENPDFNWAAPLQHELGHKADWVDAA